jgi:hypothetical protein
MKEYFERLTGQTLTREAAIDRLAYAKANLIKLGVNISDAESCMRAMDQKSYTQNMKNTVVEYLDAKNDLSKFSS